MDNFEIKELNEIIEEYVTSEETYIEDFSMLKVLNDYVIENHIKIKRDQKYNNRVGINSSYKLSYEFLKTINPSYSSYLEQRWNKGIFTLIENPRNLIAYSYYDKQKKDNVISLPVKNDISDAFAIVHEIIHDMNLKESIDTSFSFHVFCESLSILSEFLLEDYLKEKLTTSSDIYKDRREVFHAINYKSYIVDFEYFIIDRFLKKGRILDYDITKYLNTKQKDLHQLFNYVLSDILDEKQLSIDIEQRNIFGIFFASYMHQRILENPRKIEEFIKINDEINYMDFYDILKYLDLEIEDYEFGELKHESYKKLFKSYKKELRGIH